MKATLLGLTLALTSLASAPAADTPADGYELFPLEYPGQSLVATLANGDLVAFDGLSVDLFDPAGGHVRNLATFPSFAFGSFLRVAPGEAFVLLGESSRGDLFRVALDGSGATPVANLPGNYDAAFEDADHVLVSAALGGFGTGNDLLRLELSTGAETPLGRMDGASGPIVLDPAGNLYYGVSSGSFPAPAGSSRVVRFDAALLDGSKVLAETDGVLVSAGFDGAASLAYDPVLGDLYLAENNFGSGINRIRRVEPTAASSPVLVDGPPFQSIAQLEYAPGGGQARMRAYQPAEGGSLRYTTTDFFSVFERTELVPRRPFLFLSGPGTTGAGPLDLHVLNAPPSGTAFLVYGPLALFDPAEYAIQLKQLEFPLLFGLDPGTLSVWPAPAVLDATGAATVGFTNPTGQTGVLAVQALVHDGARFAGTSSAAFQ